MDLSRSRALLDNLTIPRQCRCQARRALARFLLNVRLKDELMMNKGQ